MSCLKKQVQHEMVHPMTFAITLFFFLSPYDKTFAMTHFFVVFFLVRDFNISYILNKAKAINKDNHDMWIKSEMSYWWKQVQDEMVYHTI